MLITRAAHGRPYALALRKVVDDSVANPAEAARQVEAGASERALRLGVILCFACVALLTSGWASPGTAQATPDP